MVSDIILDATCLIPKTTQLTKPSYLVLMKNGKNTVNFITIDKPDLVNGFVQAKGFFSEAKEEEIIEGYVTIVNSVKRDLILDMMFPWHSIISIRSLVFKSK